MRPPARSCSRRRARRTRSRTRARARRASSAFTRPGGLDRFLAGAREILRQPGPTRTSRRSVSCWTATTRRRPRATVPDARRVRVVRSGRGRARCRSRGATIRDHGRCADTGGLFAAGRVHGAAGVSGARLRTGHREIVDMFYVLDGELTLRDRRRDATARSRRVRRSSRPERCTRSRTLGREPVRFLSIVSPGGFEQYFRDAGGGDRRRADRPCGASGRSSPSTTTSPPECSRSSSRGRSPRARRSPTGRTASCGSSATTTG